MAIRYLAANRFGLGRRHDDPEEPADERRDLLRQLDAFAPAPPLISGAVDRAAIARAYMNYDSAREALRQDTKAKQRAGRTDAMADSSVLRDSLLATRMPYHDAQYARLYTAVASPTPFAERLTHFWANHFAISADKLAVIGFTGNHEFEAIRPHVMGTFADMLIAAVRHPAMLFYLDQQDSVGPDSPLAQSFRTARPPLNLGVNENLAREILELHTLGVRTGYTQSDVTAFAHALTGLAVAGLGKRPIQRAMPSGATPGDTLFIEQMHQPGPKTILGRRYGRDGERQGEAILRDLAVHPATARHIATKLARHFAGDTPPPSLIARLAADFRRTGGDLPSLYRTLVSSPEPWATDIAMFKSPWDWTVSMMRALKVPTFLEKENLNAMFGQLGQPIWRPGSPAGYADTVATWAGSAALMQRVELINRVSVRVGDRVDARHIAPHILADALTPRTSEAIGQAASPAQGLVLLFASPTFLRR